jgi:hypothetical protein
VKHRRKKIDLKKLLLIIKQISRRGDSKPLVSYLLKYISRDGKLVRKEQSNCSLLWSHNLTSRTIDGYIKEFRQNATLRSRKNAPTIGHIILSFHAHDSRMISDKTLLAICKEYVRQRGDNSLYLFAVHRDRSHVHIHACQSTNTVSGRSNRISQAKFAEIKLKITEYQKRKFPELSNSLPCHGKGRQRMAIAAIACIQRSNNQKEKEAQVMQFKAIREKAKVQSMELNRDPLERALCQSPIQRPSKRVSEESLIFPKQEFTWGLGLSP